LRTARSWNSAHAVPTALSNARTVPFATPVIRQVERMEFPSTRAATTATCLEKGSLFMSNIMLERSCNVKRKVQQKQLPNVKSLPYTRPPQPKPLDIKKERRKPVTLIAGFRCADGVVLCADTQLTYPGALKFPESKIRRILASNNQIRCAFAYTGYDDFSEMCMQEISAALSNVAPTWEEIRDSIKEKCRNIHIQYYPLYKAPYKLGLELLMAVGINDKVRLFQIRGPIVAQVSRFRCSGAGTYLGHAFSSSLYDRHMTVDEAGRMAAYVLYQAKAHVDGVDGKSQILKIRDNGEWGVIEAKEVEYLEAI
jgi:20S proteasome alpha/beta subunit